MTESPSTETVKTLSPALGGQVRCLLGREGEGRPALWGFTLEGFGGTEVVSVVVGERRRGEWFNLICPEERWWSRRGSECPCRMVEERGTGVHRPSPKKRVTMLSPAPSFLQERIFLESPGETFPQESGG